MSLRPIRPAAHGRTSPKSGPSGAVFGTACGAAQQSRAQADGAPIHHASPSRRWPCSVWPPKGHFTSSLWLIVSSLRRLPGNRSSPSKRSVREAGEHAMFQDQHQDDEYGVQDNTGSCRTACAAAGGADKDRRQQRKASSDCCCSLHFHLPPNLYQVKLAASSVKRQRCGRSTMVTRRVLNANEPGRKKLQCVSRPSNQQG